MSCVVVTAATYPVVHSKSGDTREKWAATELSPFLKKSYAEDDFPVSDSAPQKGAFIMIRSG
jgi:hypothetical protein